MNSTRPLTALRVKALNQPATKNRQIPSYQLAAADQKVRWGLFPLEFLARAAPFVAIVALAVRG